MSCPDRKLKLSTNNGDQQQKVPHELCRCLPILREAWGILDGLFHQQTLRPLLAWDLHEMDQITPLNSVGGWVLLETWIAQIGSSLKSATGVCLPIRKLQDRFVCRHPGDEWGVPQLSVSPAMLWPKTWFLFVGFCQCPGPSIPRRLFLLVSSKMFIISNFQWNFKFIWLVDSSMFNFENRMTHQTFFSGGLKQKPQLLFHLAQTESTSCRRWHVRPKSLESNSRTPYLWDRKGSAKRSQKTTELQVSWTFSCAPPRASRRERCRNLAQNFWVTWGRNGF